MVDKRFGSCALYEELDESEQKALFNFKQKKFLNNVDTFYYSVKFKNDFRYDTKDMFVKQMRKTFDIDYHAMENNWFNGEFDFDGLSHPLMLRRVTFSRFYSICLSYPEYFDIFIAPTVPKNADGGESVTSECIVQIRSYMLWLFGVRDAFENSYAYVKAFAKRFHLDIDFVQENRIDYCWHTNFLDNPEKFFEPQNFYKMRVDRFKNATYVTNKVGSEDYEIDYVALGKRSDKVFVRIYQKTREVIEQGYKPWFFQVWRMNEMISEYDMYVYERAYEKHSWFYRFYARLEFYAMHGKDPELLEQVNDILSGKVTKEENDLIKFCNDLTPRLHLIVNVEFQTMRRHSKSYELVPFKDNSKHGEAKRVYDYLDNRKIIQEYLTTKVLRLVNPDMSDIRKDRRPLTQFWDLLTKARCIDMKMTSDQVHLLRNYNRKLNIEAMKKRVINGAVTLGFYVRGINEDSPLQDCFEALLKMNDNDIQNAMSYKNKRRSQLNKKELANVFESKEVHRYQFVDLMNGTIYDNDTAFLQEYQEDCKNEGS